METTSLIVDYRSVRCGQCKMLIRDVTVADCPHCHAVFDRVTSNHVGLAERVQRQRAQKKSQAPQKETRPAG